MALFPMIHGRLAMFTGLLCVLPGFFVIAGLVVSGGGMMMFRGLVMPFCSVHVVF